MKSIYIIRDTNFFMLVGWFVTFCSSTVLYCAVLEQFHTIQCDIAGVQDGTVPYSIQYSKASNPEKKQSYTFFTSQHRNIALLPPHRYRRIATTASQPPHRNRISNCIGNFAFTSASQLWLKNYTTSNCNWNCYCKPTNSTRYHRGHQPSGTGFQEFFF